MNLAGHFRRMYQGECTRPRHAVPWTPSRPKIVTAAGLKVFTAIVRGAAQRYKYVQLQSIWSGKKCSSLQMSLVSHVAILMRKKGPTHKRSARRCGSQMVTGSDPLLSESFLASGFNPTGMWCGEVKMRCSSAQQWESYFTCLFRTHAPDADWTGDIKGLLSEIIPGL